MKTRFTTIDLMAALHDIRSCIGFRVYNVYDVDHKLYLIRLMKPDSKTVLLIESGNRMYLTEYDYPKNVMPSSFSMKLRKHIKQKRLERADQLGVDRIVDLQFGSGEVACHVIVELYDRGNVVLTDHEYLILNVLRPRTDKEDKDVKFVVREKYPLHLAKQQDTLIQLDELSDMFSAAKPNDNLRKILTHRFLFGPALLEHCLIQAGFSCNTPLSKLDQLNDVAKVYEALKKAYELFNEIRTSRESCQGFIALKRDRRADGEIVESYQEFHPVLFEQFKKSDAYKSYDTFNAAVDEFFSKIETQKIDVKSIQQEKTVIKKLENVRKDHENRVKSLQETQTTDKRRAELIEMNKELVDRAIIVVNSALASQMTWSEVQELIDEAKLKGDKVATSIKALALDINRVTLKLADPYYDEDFDDVNEHVALVDIDLGCNAYQNACKYYTHKKQSAVKEQKTLQASEKALKSAEVKTQELLKQVQTNRQINKSRKTFWFEKFLWFISSDGCLVVGGRDAQQNELLVKRYLRAGDAYVHADIRGAASVIVKHRRQVALPSDPKTESSSLPDLPPKTLSEAGTMAICHSAAWDAKVITSAWWVHAEQVSKTAPTGEYLTTGSFMIRGKKNFLPPCQLIMGFGVMFKLDDESAAKRLAAKKKLALEQEPLADDVAADKPEEDDEEIRLDEAESDQEEVDFKEENTGEEHFPDINVDLKRLVSNEAADDDTEYSVINIGPAARIVCGGQQAAKGSAASKNRQKQKGQTGKTKNDEKQVGSVVSEPPSTVTSTCKSGQMKRGQKSKLKKIKEKYKDQDEEERELRLRLLGSKKVFERPIQEEPTVTNNNDEGSTVEKIERNPEIDFDQEEKPPGEEQEKTDDLDHLDDKDDVAEEESASKFSQETFEAMDALTGIPAEDDLDEILLFAIPVCAPYSVMNSWKFKVKLTPGTGKKGRATKTAIEVFAKDRSSTQREKDLLRVLADQDLSRNLPGKVKVSAPHLHDVKKKR